MRLLFILIKKKLILTCHGYEKAFDRKSLSWISPTRHEFKLIEIQCEYQTPIEHHTKN